ncbi:MAG: ACT domain-containing protein [Leptotrichiaceae bacterium]|jgi:ACT domain-containing protein|nr:ACT domain-containing protein [Leptotrichiaceae bacterium]MBP6281028.1 ACT domain-containing protein [Leptotrichiaceae bacterium]MBP7100375.1 ACT domain-containing protein [Leptotrichiaceae bacterium]MBP7725022.1 ACT domain-containing protein [Leptotrichiaceae bacterium]MBP9629615.1 ACT domain-containing protein [Leptotrichiaceae bacterium]
MNDKIVVTVIGNDKTGIVANVSTKLSELKLNIIDITQKVFENDIFAMIMLIESGEQKNIKFLQEEFKTLENEIGVRIFLQHEDIFKTMHRI